MFADMNNSLTKECKIEIQQYIKINSRSAQGRKQRTFIDYRDCHETCELFEDVQLI